jgi:2-C-methyl-D-erythritol 2,4-cyclodiphosphate synthase
MRIGQGVDVHAFSADQGRPLILGGVVVPGARGLDGHSDADVATHALIDALLGAGGLGDIGRHFPSDSSTSEGISSLILLEQTLGLLDDAEVHVLSADVTIVAQEPKLSPHLDSMAKVLSERVGVAISVKATTTDSLGFIGHGEGIAALAVALVDER